MNEDTPSSACHPRRVTIEQPTAFVLGGGGILGAAEVGMLRALLERGIVPDLIVGSSVGALNGAFIAADPSTASVERMVDVWTGLSDRGVFGGSVFGQLSTLARHGTHLCASSPKEPTGPRSVASGLSATFGIIRRLTLLVLRH